LLNLKARTKGKLADGQPIGGRGRLMEGKVKQLQKYYGLAIRQNTIKKSNPTEREVDVAVYAMKKNIIATLHHGVKSQPNNIVSVLQESRRGASGSRMQHLVLQRTKTLSVYQRSFLKFFALHL